MLLLPGRAVTGTTHSARDHVSPIRDRSPNPGYLSAQRAGWAHHPPRQAHRRSVDGPFSVFAAPYATRLTGRVQPAPHEAGQKRLSAPHGWSTMTLRPSRGQSTAPVLAP